MGSTGRSENCDYDVGLVGGGPTGINTAYYMQKKFPDFKYAIPENRGVIGGIRNIFRYPGIRSDSDLYTLGFTWRPWASSMSIAAEDYKSAVGHLEYRIL
ncbi:hypothetical protein DID88_009214 [Monilinia fructigena]|uniref:FAD/NAD(P)-binding domain-containing protein n=1 Tax=Monilinia fructigena TaxID=38457 RepID=A0A395IHV5_9HELO|nr:hypothetical protein DID88_009214 [Monilinia fructigena]